MTNKKRLARIGIIAASFVMMLALGVATWAAFTGINFSLEPQDITTDFACPATLTATCEIVDGGEFETVLGSEDVVILSESATTGSFDNITLTEPNFALTYTFVIVCANAEYFDDLEYAITYTFGTGLVGSIDTNFGPASGPIADASPITVSYKVAPDIGLKSGAALNISFAISITQS